MQRYFPRTFGILDVLRYLLLKDPHGNFQIRGLQMPGNAILESFIAH